MPLTWIPSYEAIATALAQFEDRQAELLALLTELRKRDLPVITLVDQTKTGPAPLEAIDPFTVFAAFNRRTRTEHRITIIEALMAKLGASAPTPSDFEGIPIVDNRASWFFHYAKERAPDEIPNLWRLARGVVGADPLELDGDVFERCCAAIGVGMITTAMYWLRPRVFLPLDRRTRALLESKGLDPNLTASKRWTQYRELLSAVRRLVGSDFPELSRLAYTTTQAQPTGSSRRMWIGGSVFGKDSQLDRFLAENIWELGHGRDSDSAVAKKAIERFDSIRVGDLLAIKTFGGRYHLRVHRVGRVTEVDAANRRVRIAPIEVPLFRGRAPQRAGTNGTWFDSIAEVTDPEAIAAVFEGREVPTTLPPPPERDAIPLNLILHGPPGTGKTWALTNVIRAAFDPASPAESPPVVDVAGLTWFQVIALAVHELGRADVKTITTHPLVQAKYAERAVPTKLSNIVWAQLQGHTIKESKRVNYSRRSDPLVFDRDDEGRWYLVQGLPEELELLTSKEDEEDRTPENEFFVTFHPSFTYEDFVEGMRPEPSADDESVVKYVVRPGIFKQACERAVQLAGFNNGLDAFCRLSVEERRKLLDDAPPVLLMIDEINRGNVARIFGELITLLEADKRLGGANEITVVLPGSRQKFGVPSNLWVVGTMNTADRSVVALDTALRRRFAFREHAPQPALLSETTVDGVDIGRLLETINARLVRLRDRDHLIGHAFFMPMRDDPAKRNIDELRRVFREAIVPLLAEYFYDDLGRIGLVLGDAFVKRDDTRSDVFAKSFDHDQREDLAERPVYRLVDLIDLDANAFRSIYA